MLASVAGNFVQIVCVGFHFFFIDFLLKISIPCQLPIAYCLLPVVYPEPVEGPIAYCLLPIANYSFSK
jgi:hypothetical protein